MTRRFFVPALTALSALPLAAQEMGPREGGPPRGGMNRLGFLTSYLGLSDSQKQQAQAIFDASDQASEPVREQLTTARQALRSAIKAGKTDAEMDTLAIPVGTAEGELAAIQAKASAKLYALLTSEQKTKYDQLEERGGPGGPGGPGGFRRQGFGRQQR